MRVLYFSKGYTVHDRRFLTALGDSDHQIHFLRLEQNDSQEAEFELPRNVTPMDWKRSSVRKGDPTNLVMELKRILAELSPDLVHAGPVQSCAYPIALTNFNPLLTMSWGSDILVDAQTNPGRSEAIFTLSRSNLFACDCETVARAAQDLGMPTEDIVIFPWGVDLDHFTPGSNSSLRSRLGWEEAMVFLSTRAHEKIYGVEILVEGFVRAAKDHPKVRLLVLNEGSLTGNLVDILAREGVDDRVHFAGTVGLPHLPDYYQAADVYLSASRSDGSSISLLEAMASGLPGLVSDIPGNQEWIEPGFSGWLFQDGNADDLAERIGKVLREPSVRKVFGSNARQIAQKRADWKRNFQQLLDAYALVQHRSKTQG